MFEFSAGLVAGLCVGFLLGVGIMGWCCRDLLADDYPNIDDPDEGMSYLGKGVE